MSFVEKRSLVLFNVVAVLELRSTAWSLTKPPHDQTTVEWFGHCILDFLTEFLHYMGDMGVISLVILLL